MSATISEGWKRVTKAEPCKICGKGDWCTVGLRYRCCMRVPSATPAKNGNGWLHEIAGAPAPAPHYRPVKIELAIDWDRILKPWYEQRGSPTLYLLAKMLGVEVQSLECLGVVWAPPHTAWAFPMRNAYGRVIGIRLRAEDGKKWAVTGSHNGLFFSQRTNAQEMLVVCEGPTDTAAALSLGYFAVGRPFCYGCEDDICRLVRRCDCRRVMIFADNDERKYKLTARGEVSEKDPGNQGYIGAVRLAKALPVPSLIMAAPGKDLREFYQSGGERGLIDSLAETLIWNVPRK